MSTNTGVVITSIVETEPNVVEITTAGTPNGSLGFFVGSTPDYDNAVLTPHTGANPYTLNVPGSNIWYIWADDNDGPSVEESAVCTGDGINVVRPLGQYLAQLIWENRKGIDAAVSLVYPNTTLKSAFYGIAAMADDFPSVNIEQPRWSYEWHAFPRVKEFTYTFLIRVVVLYNDYSSEVDLSTQLATAVAAILDKWDYIELNLPDGTPIYNAHTTGSVTTMDLGDRLAEVATIVWTGQCQVQMM